MDYKRIIFYNYNIFYLLSFILLIYNIKFPSESPETCLPHNQKLMPDWIKMKNKFFLSTDMVDSKVRDEFWREAIKPVYEVTGNADENVRGFRGSLSWHRMGSLLVGRSSFNSQHYRRTKRTILQSGLDHYIVNVAVTGTMHGNFNGIDVLVEPGDIHIVDLSQTSSGSTTTGTRISINIPRNELDKLVGWRNIHGVVLKSHLPMTKLLSEYIQAIVSTQANLNAAEAIGIKDVFLSLLASSINGSNSDLTGDRLPGLTMRRRIIVFIEDNLTSPRLGLQSILQHFHISRSNLYRIFEADGGVARVIRDKRLERAYRMILFNRDKAHSFKEISYRCGFNDPSQFTKAFKSLFGVAPNAVRQTDHLPRTSEDSILILENYLKAQTEKLSE